MDPSYSPYTGSQFGATPGAGGFSGAQPGAGFGSGAGTGMQPGFGGGAGSSISSGTGDIVLSKTGGKSKKPLIIGLIVFVLLAIAGAVAAVVVMNMNKSNKYGLFGELILYGVNNDRSKFPDINGRYAIQDIVIRPEKDDMQNYYRKIIDAENLLAEKKDLSLDIMYINAWIDASWFYFFQDSELVEIFENSGEQAAVEYIDAAYSEYTNSGDEELARVGNNLTWAETNYLAFIKEYEKDGCKLSVVSDECKNRKNEVASNFKKGYEPFALTAYEKAGGLLWQTINRIKVSK